jgi:hypothetical protein
MGDLAVNSDTLSTASILPDPSSSNAPSKRMPQSAVDGWNLTFSAAKLANTAQDAGWQPVSANPWPAEAASNAQPSPKPSTGSQRSPPGGTYDPKTDTWERTPDWPPGLNPIDPATAKPFSSQPPSSFPYAFPLSTPSSAASDILPDAPTSPAAFGAAPNASFADRFGPTTPAQTAGGTSAAAGATPKAPHPPATRRAGTTTSPIDPESLPPGPLNKTDYARVTERNRYLAKKYDPDSLIDRFINSFTDAMNDPANVRTPSEQAEHEALTKKIADTVFPRPILAEARVDMMEASPVGTSLSLGTRAIGGGQQAQDLALIAGSTVDTFGLGRALQPGGRPPGTAGAIRPKTIGVPEEPLSAIGRSAPVPLSPADTTGNAGSRAARDIGASLQTGGGSIEGPADAAYDAIRASTTDVESIAGNTGYKAANIQKIKDHVFVEEHLLDRYEGQGVPAEWRRFDSSLEIAETWKRLETGTHGPADLELLKHETAEAWYMRNVSPSFNASHEAAERHFPTPIR